MAAQDAKPLDRSLDSFDKRILVTVNLDKLDYCASLKSLQAVYGRDNYKFVKGSITSSDLVTFVMSTYNIDTVMHFAAQSHVDNSFGNSFTFTENNILGTHVLLEASKLQQVSLFLHVSTDEVYGDGTGDQSHTEGSLLDPTNPYAATKAGAEFLVKAYHKSFGLPTIITRSNNVYGPQQYPEKLIPKFINQLLRGQRCTLHGDGSNTRNYLYVTDVAAAFDTILHKGQVPDVYNISSPCEKSNADVTRSLLHLMGKVPPTASAVALPATSSAAAAADSQQGDELKATTHTASAGEPDGRAASLDAPVPPEVWAAHVAQVEDRPFNDLRYHLDGSRLADMGWAAQVQWRDGLAETVQWYREHTQHWGGIDTALVAHPRHGLTEQDVKGVPPAEERTAGGLS